MSTSPSDSDPTTGSTPETEADAPRSSVAESFTRYARASGLRRDDQGRLDVLHAVGGWRGLTEAILPGAVFLTVFVVTARLPWALTGALGAAGVFTVVRLAQRQTLVQALAGLVGVAVCAVVALRGGQAIDYYVPGLWINGVYAVMYAVSIAIGWPLLGVIFGFIRGEGMEWRADPARMRAYRLATGLVLVMFLVRLAVQLPLYWAGNVAWLGITRLSMGLPLYAVLLWVGWLMSRPAAIDPVGHSDALERDTPGHAESADDSR